MSTQPEKAVHYTYKDYMTWSYEERWELIQGYPYAMSPAPSTVHQTVSLELSTQIALYLRDKACRVFTAPFDVRLPDDKDEPDDKVDNVVQPDICVICDEHKIDDRGCRGAPDWIIEIVSPSSAAQDQIRKLALYERHGVKAYWIAHPIDRVVTIFHLEENASYGKPKFIETKGQLPVDKFHGLTIDWEIVFTKLPASE